MEMQRLKPETPNRCHLSGEACGGLKPLSLRYPRRSAGGLCLASTAALVPREECQLWLHRLTQRALLTRGPSLSGMPDKERYSSTTSVLLESWTRYAWNPATRLERNP